MTRSACTAGELCIRDVAVASPTTSVDDAARRMRALHVGCLVVVEDVAAPDPDADAGRTVVGVLTDRDIVTSVIARDVAPSALRVGEVMTADVTCVPQDASIADTLTAMRLRGVRRVPVVGPDRRLVGIVAADDLMRVLTGQLLSLASTLGEQPEIERAARP